MTDTERDTKISPKPPAEHRHNIADDLPQGLPAGDPGDDSPGMPGGTLGTGGAREQDR